MRDDDEATLVTAWLDEGFREAVSVARRPWLQQSPAERIMRLINARAGKSPIARFSPGELGRLVRMDEADVHEAIEALIHAQQLGAESHPGFQLVPGSVPDYVEPAPASPPVPEGMRAEVVPNRRTGSWTTRLVRAKENT